MTTRCKLTKDDKSTKANANWYKSMIGGLLYLTATRLDIMYIVCLVARFQQELKESHVVAMKMIFKYHGNEIFFIRVRE